MSRPRNTRDQIIPIPAVHGYSVPGAIDEQEAEGAAAMQRGDCEIIPAKGVPDEELTALGFVLGPVDDNDRLFRQATLPPGWKRAGTGHSMHTDIVDELGRKRIGIFYKAAYYDRRADLSITTVYGYVQECLYHGTTPVLDDSWATREAVVVALDSIAGGGEEPRRPVVAPQRGIRPRVRAGGPGGGGQGRGRPCRAGRRREVSTETNVYQIRREKLATALHAWQTSPEQTPGTLEDHLLGQGLQLLPLAADGGARFVVLIDGQPAPFPGQSRAAGPVDADQAAEMFLLAVMGAAETGTERVITVRPAADAELVADAITRGAW